MKYKKTLITITALLFFLSALTSYVNRVLFPQLIKKIAIERIEDALKRKVEIGTIRFNWVKGFIIDKIKIYDKDSNERVFAQAEQVSFGILIFPSLKHYRITIPFINVRSPSAHLIRISKDTWNFSDMIQASSTNKQETSAPVNILPHAEKPSPFEIAWGGITVSDGKFLVDDTSSPQGWSELFDNINLKLTLSYKSINYNFTADIPAKKGFIGAAVSYQPATKNTQAQIHLKNIDTASYLSLISIPDVRLDNGVIKEVDLNINYTQNQTSAQGDMVIDNLNVSNHGQTFRGDIQIHGLDAVYTNGGISARGLLALNNIETIVPGLTTRGSAQTRVDQFELTKQGLAFSGSLQAQQIFVSLKDRQVKLEQAALDNIKIRKDQDGIQSVGSIRTRGLWVQWPHQQLQGDIALRAVTMQYKDADHIDLRGELQADDFSTAIDEKKISSRHISLEDFDLSILEQKNITLCSKISLNKMNLTLGENIFLSAASVTTDKLTLNLGDGKLQMSSVINSTKCKIVLDHHKTIEADPQVDLALQLPLNKPQDISYKGSVTLSDAHLWGFTPGLNMDNVELDADFQNDQASINALNINVLDTNLRIYGTVKNFKDPYLDVTVDADDVNLAKIHDFAPQIVDQFGLIFDGSSVVKLKFSGLASQPLLGSILLVASVKNAGVTSSKLHQQLKNITGIIEATPNSLKWRDFTASYANQKFALCGTLNDFKNPRIMSTLEGPNFELKADLTKNNDLLAVNSLNGRFFNATFDSKGSINLKTGQGPGFEINSHVTLLLENIIKLLPAGQKASIQALRPSGMISMNAQLKGTGVDWKNYNLNAQISSPTIGLLSYSLTDMKINIDQGAGKIKNVTFDGKLYDGTVHAVGSLDLTAPGMPYDLAFNIDNTDLHKLKMDSPLKMEEIDGKLFLTTLAHGTIADFKDNVHATGSMAVRDGFLAEFNLFKGLLGILNDVMRLGQIMITDVEGNFSIENQRINTDNLRLKGPTIVLLGQGWVNFDQDCDLNMTVDLSSGVVPAIAHDVLSSLKIRIYDKIANPKFKRKISVPQVINTLLKNLLQ